ncbi:hypothetical protein Tco_1116785 [Tanacetum coccineum]
METKYGLWVLIMAFVSTSYAKLDSIVKHIFDYFDFKGESGFLQFWECCASGDLEDRGCNLFLRDQSRFSHICNNRLKNFRRACLNNNYRFVGREENVGNCWLDGPSAAQAHQLQITKHVGECLGYGVSIVVTVVSSGAVLDQLCGNHRVVTAHEQVRTRFKNLENNAFSIAYKDTNLNHHLILNDRDLQFCITESISNRKTLIRMVIEDVEG